MPKAASETMEAKLTSTGPSPENVYIYIYIWGFPKIRGTILGFPIIKDKDYSIWGSILGSPHFGKLPYINCYECICLCINIGFRVAGYTYLRVKNGA